MATITDSIGRVLAGRYRIESALGSGASAHVFAAWDVKLKRRVALKVLHPSLEGDGAFLRRLRAEAQAAASLSHPNVLAVYDWGEDEGGPFLVLEYLAGGSLRDLLDAGHRLSVAQAVSVGIDAADGLAFAHGRGFVHRDIKPANLLFGEDGRLRVADFGLARALAEASYTEPVGATVGTARYVAPEQAQGRPVDGRADVYALALVLYESVTTVVPFAADTMVSTLMARVGARLPGHDALGPLSGLLAEAAAPEPDERLDAATLAHRLRLLADSVGRGAPLPLAVAPGAPAWGAEPAAARVAEGSADPTDVTQHGRQPVPVAADGGPPSAPGAGKGDAGARSRGRRRVSGRAALALAAALLLVGGAAYGSVALKVFVASHRLVALTGDTTTAAGAALAKEHFSLRVLRHRSSVTVPSGHVIRQIPAAGTPLKEGSTVQVVLSSGPPPVTLPALASVSGDCVGVTKVLASAGLKVACTHQSSTTVSAGTVISWSPKGHAPLGSVVDVVVSSGPPSETIASLTGSTCAAATTTLQAVNLTAKCVEVYSTTVPSGQVVSWSPTGTAPEGATVTVNVSQGPPPVVVPNVINDTLAQAITVMQNAGLNPQAGQSSLGGHVFATNPQPGTSVPEGTAVTLYAK